MFSPWIPPRRLPRTAPRRTTHQAHHDDPPRFAELDDDAEIWGNPSRIPQTSRITEPPLAAPGRPMEGNRQLPSVTSKSQSHHAIGRSPLPPVPRPPVKVAPLNVSLPLATELLPTNEKATGASTLLPDVDTLTRRAYVSFKADAQKMADVSDYVTRLPISRQQELAMACHERRHRGLFQSMRHRDVFDVDVHKQRAAVSYRLAVEDVTTRFENPSTRELARIRIAGAAVDETLWRDARKAATDVVAEAQQQLIPVGTSRVELLGLRLDAWRKRHVPQPPRRLMRGSGAAGGVPS